MKKWYVLIRENTNVPSHCHCGCGKALTAAEKEANRNVPISIHWDRSKLPAESNGYRIVEVDAQV